MVFSGLKKFFVYFSRYDRFSLVSLSLSSDLIYNLKEFIGFCSSAASSKHELLAHCSCI